MTTVVARVVQKTTRSRAEMTMTWYIRDRYAEFCKVLRRQTVQTLVHGRAQFEDDALRDVQPVQFIVKELCVLAARIYITLRISVSMILFTRERLALNPFWPTPKILACPPVRPTNYNFWPRPCVSA